MKAESKVTRGWRRHKWSDAKALKQFLLSRRRVDAVTKCWLWTGAVTRRGYGQMMIEGRLFVVTEVAMRVFRKLQPRQINQQNCHTCDNPRCFNPTHLFRGNQSVNMLDAVRKGRQANARKTHCPKGHPLSGSNLTAVIDRGWRSRHCRACMRERSKRYRKAATRRAS